MAKVTNKYPGESRWKGWLYLLPALLVYLFFTLLPILETIRSSFYQWDGFSQNRVWIGLANYAELFTDPKFHNALRNNLIFVVFYSIIPILIGLFLASLLSRRKIPGFAFFRTLGLVTKLMWVSALMATTRKTHGERHGNLYTREQVSDFYSVDGNAINCRCSQVPTIVDANGDMFAKKILEKMDKQKERWEETQSKKAA